MYLTNERENNEHTYTIPPHRFGIYIEGTRTRNVALLGDIFHEKIEMTGWMGPDFISGGSELFLSVIEANEIAPDYSAEILNEGSADKIAWGTIAEENLLGMSFENHFHMIQIDDGTWRIISKLFRHF